MAAKKRGPTYPKSAIIKAIKNTGGIVNNAAQALGCSRQTIYNAMERWPEVAQARKDEIETLKDVVEEKLIEQIMQGNMTAIIWFSKTQMKDRGYVERVESSGPDGGPIRHEDATVDASKLPTALLRKVKAALTSEPEG